MTPDQAFFITGTDTDIGKTMISAILTIGLNATYWKPIQSGSIPSTDTNWIKSVSELSDDHFLKETYRLKEPLSPHQAAEIDQITIDKTTIRLPDRVNHLPLIVEGAGGLMVPLNNKHFMIDLIEDLKLPVVLVARSALGTINHTTLSIQALRQRGIPILGVVMNGPRNRGNCQAIERFGRVEVIAEVEPLKVVDRATLLQTYNQKFGHFREEFLG
jgi:dethiobiotin synthetase